ncbi:MAG: hypothetical protein AAB484_00905 [Patescibacteria group bacterium]
MKKVFFTSCIVVLAILTAQSVLAQSIGSLLTKTISSDVVFGGKITSIEKCTCLYDLATVVTIDDVATKKSLNLKYSVYYSKLRPHYNIFTKGAYILGGGTKKGVLACLNQKSYYCDSSSTKINAIIDSTRGVGTSAK